MTYTMREGWLWPAEDTISWPVLLAEARRMPELLALVPQKRVAVQAGGHCGLLVRPLADAFEAVYTFEPSPSNFNCLVNNIPDANVCRIQACLGAEATGPVRLSGWAQNSAASYIAGGEEMPHFGPVKSPAIPVLTIDSLQLPVVDLIMLDMEGYEYHALEGAKATISRCRPVIVVELIGHGRRYGVADADVRAKLKWHGYREAARLERDSVFVFDKK